MNRRSSVVAVVAACTIPAAVGAGAATEPEMPRLGCARRWSDPAGDAYVNPTRQSAGQTEQLKSKALDIVSAYVRTTADEVQVFLKVTDVPAAAEMPKNEPAYRYNVSLKYGGATFTISHMLKNPQYDAALASKPTPFSEPPITGLKGGINAATDIVYVTVPRAAFEQKAGVPLAAGEKFTAISAKSEFLVYYNDQTIYLADDVKPAGDAATWSIGDDYCFGLPPASLLDVATPGTQFSDATTFTAKLVDELGAPIANEQVKFVVAGEPPIAATSDGSGVVTAPFTATLPAGTYPVKVQFDGTPTIGKTVATSDLVITTEATKFPALAVKKTSATGREVTATLLDGDDKVLGAQKVAWYVNGKFVSTLTTSATGRSVLKTAKAGQTVQARFLGDPGKYAGSRSVSRKI